MPKLLTFVLVGYLFAEIIEFQFNIFITKNFGSWIFTLFYYPVLLAFTYLINKFIDKIFRNKKVADIIYYLGTTSFGLFGMEWTIIGNSPWGNPEASQIGMWSFWAAVFFMPRIFTNPSPQYKTLKKRIAKYMLVYTIITLAAGLALPATPQMVIIIWAEIIGYTGMQLFYYDYIFKKY